MQQAAVNITIKLMDDQNGFQEKIVENKLSYHDELELEKKKKEKRSQ